MYPKLQLSAGPRVLKQTARKLVSPVQLHHKSCVSLVDIVSSADSLRSSRNSVQALLESRHCIPRTRFNRLETSRGGAGGEPEPADIEGASIMDRRRSGQRSDSESQCDGGVYAPLDWDNLPGRATRLLRLE